MKILVSLAINNFKRYKRESIMVILSISLTISLLTLVATLITSVYATSVQEIVNYNPFNVEISNIKDANLLIKSFKEDLLYYELSNYSDEYVEVKDRMNSVVNLQQYYADEYNADESKIPKIIEGRDSQGRHEIVVLKGDGLKLGDKVKLNSEHEADHDFALVVGYTNYHSFYYKDTSTINNLKESAGSMNIIFKPGSKNIDQYFENMQDNSIYHDNATVRYNSDFNYLLGMQNTPGSVMYVALGFAVILMLLVSLMTFTLILNALEANMSQKNQSFSVLRTIGTTKHQMRVIIFIEIGVLALISLFLGIIGGIILSHGMISSINTVLKAINAVQFGYSETTVMFWSPYINYFVIVGISLLLVFIALTVKTYGLYKTSAIESQKSITQTNTKRYSLRSHVIYSLAQINSKRSKSYKGVKTAIFISSFIIIVLVTMVNIMMQVPGQTLIQFDTVVTGLNFEQYIEIDFDDDIAEIETIFTKYPEIKEHIVLKESSSLVINFDKHQVQNTEENFDPRDMMSLQTIILRDKDFEDIKDQYNIDVNAETIYMDSFEVIGFETVANPDKFDHDNYDLGLEDRDTLYLNHTEYDEKLSITLDAVLKFDIPDSEIINNKRPGLYISESYYNQHFKDRVMIRSYIIYADTDLEPQRIQELNKTLHKMDKTYNFHAYSDLSSLYISKVIKETTNAIASFIFAYIGIVIIMNITNITLVSFRQRRKELASLQSIGSSKKQIVKLIMFETLNVMLLPYILSVIFANLVSYILFLFYRNVLIKSLDLVFEFSFLANLLTLLLLVVTLVIVYISIKKESSKTSIIEDIKFY